MSTPDRINRDHQRPAPGLMSTLQAAECRLRASGSTQDAFTVMRFLIID